MTVEEHASTLVWFLVFASVMLHGIVFYATSKSQSLIACYHRSVKYYLLMIVAIWAFDIYNVWAQMYLTINVFTLMLMIAELLKVTDALGLSKSLLKRFSQQLNLFSLIILGIAGYAAF